MKKILLMLLFAVFATAGFAQFSINDPGLKLWLKADTLTGTNVPVWFDSSTNGLVLAAPPLPPDDAQADPDNHIPLLITNTANGVDIKAVQFRQGFDPLNAPGHFADRLWQTNKLDASDPTLITPAEDITMVAVYRNDAPNATLGANQALFGKRGPSCPYLFGFNGNAIAPELLHYAGSVVYPSGLAISTSTPEYGIVIMNLTASGNLTFMDYYISNGGWRTNTTPGVPRAGGGEGVPFAMAFHTQGGGGTAGNPWGNGTYERGAFRVAELALLNRSLTGGELATLQNDLIVKYFTVPGAPTVSLQPQSQQVLQFDPVSFTAGVGGTPPFTWQWYKGATAIPGASGSGPLITPYAIASAVPGDQAFYSVAITNVAGFTNSQAAFLTVIADTNGPSITSALLNVATNTEVTVTFAELVNPASATNAGNYSISGGGSVSSVVAVPQTNNLTWSNYVFKVVLTTSPISSSQTLTATGVQDRAGNNSAAQATIVVPVIVGAPPTANRLLWLAADTNVLADNIGVYEWQDMSGAANTHNAAPGIGNTQPGLAAFPNGIHPVVSFDGSANLVLQNQPDFNLQTFSVYLVAAVNTQSFPRRWLGNWEGFTLGSSDGSGSSAQFSHLQVGGAYRPLSTGPILQNLVPAYMVATIDATNTQIKTISVNGVLRGTQTGTGTIEYGTARGLALGSLFDDGLAQSLLGNIAEVLIYSNVSPAQDAAVQQYIGSKYFGPGGTLPTLVAAYNNATNKVRVRFSDALDSTSATTATNYAVNGGVTVSSATLINSTLVELSTTALTPNQVYTLTVNNVKNWAASAVAPNSQIQLTGLNIGPISGTLMHIADLSANNVLAIEAENFTTNASPSAAGHSWFFTSVPTFLNPTDANTSGSGFGVMETQNYGTNTGASQTGPRLDYNVYFPSAGTYYSWVRGIGDGAANDSLFIGIDGAVGRGITGFPAGSGYTWGTTTATVHTNQVVVTTPGFHVINIWMREDGFALDRLVLSTNPSYNPTGVGPAASALVYRPLEVSASGGNVVLTWGGPAILTSATSVTGPFTDVLGATSPYNVTPTGSGKYYRLR